MSEFHRQKNPTVKMADLEGIIEKSKEQLETLRCLNYASCWIMATTENALMWKAYAPGGVAIRTTVRKFRFAEQEKEREGVRVSLWPHRIVYADHWQQLKRRFRHDGIRLSTDCSCTPSARRSRQRRRSGSLRNRMSHSRPVRAALGSGPTRRSSKSASR